MSDTRNYRLVRAIINGQPFMGALEGFTPPTVSKKTEESRGGRFVSGETVVGLEKLTGEIKLSGVTAELLMSQGLEAGEYSEITVLGSAEDSDKQRQPLKWEHTCEITHIKSAEIKPGKFDHTLAFTCRAYRHTDNGQVVYDINVRTQTCLIGGKDLLAEHRANVEMA